MCVAVLKRVMELRERVSDATDGKGHHARTWLGLAHPSCLVGLGNSTTQAVLIN
jgi:hypothetical protein